MHIVDDEGKQSTSRLLRALKSSGFAAEHRCIPTINDGAPRGVQSDGGTKKEPRRRGHSLSNICLADKSHTVDLLGDTILRQTGVST